jgi:hypothetical protein
MLVEITLMEAGEDMNLQKRYKTAEGIECNILQLVKTEPGWAANRIQEGEKAVEELTALKIDIRNFVKALEGSSHVNRDKIVDMWWEQWRNI